MSTRYRYWFEDLSDEDGGDFIVWEEDVLTLERWEVGRHFDQNDAEKQVNDLQYVAKVDAEPNDSRTGPDSATMSRGVVPALSEEER